MGKNRGVWIAGACVLAALSGSADAAASFSPDVLERAMLDLYCQYPAQAPGACPKAPKPEEPAEDPTPDASPSPAPSANPTLSTQQRSVWALEIFDQIAELDTDGYNDVLTHMAADYRQHPEHREAIELVLDSIDVEHSADAGGKQDHTADAVRARLKLEIKDAHSKNLVIDVMDGIVAAYALATTFEFGRGFSHGLGELKSVWRASEGALTRLKKFQDVGELFVRSQSAAKQAVWGRKFSVLAFGAGLGLSEAAIQSFAVYKIDPHHLLEPVQDDIVLAAGRLAAGERDELRALSAQADAELISHAEGARTRMGEIDKDVNRLTGEMEHLYDSAPSLRPRMDPIAQDLTEISAKLSAIEGRLDDAAMLGGNMN